MVLDMVGSALLLDLVGNAAVHLCTEPFPQQHLVGWLSNLGCEKDCFTPALADTLSVSLGLLLFMCSQSDSGSCSHQSL